MSIAMTIHNFRENNDVSALTSLLPFVGDITYKTPSKTYTGISNVRIEITGIHYGCVHISENDDFSEQILHLDLNPDFQEYEYDESENVLVISGNSAKVGGDYTVLIRCISHS